MATYLVTGGAGFIGSNLVDALLAEGHTVRVFDDLSTGRKARLDPRAELTVGDIRRIEELRPVCDGADGVFHCAALPRIPYSIEEPIETSEVNIMGTLNVLVAARDAKVKRLVYSASSSAYGDQASLPLVPDMPGHPLNPYALQKYVGELFAEEFSRFYGFETVCLRYFNVYGPRMADEGAYCTVISVFKQQRKSGEALSICGDGEQTRDFTHVSDVARANMLAMTSDKVGKGEVLNIGAGKRYSVNYIAKAVGGPLQALPARPGEARDTLADISRTKELIGWEPKIEFEWGLREYLKSEGIDPAT